ncbi:peroxiredoxin [Scopulibacillus daqui]|uniref:Peroxiredoxin n=1 Tax=Scopulibacillus daqui TaxID=1469162 RepID=A0ABS2PX25_9BACL|nr:peroxiredoxin [Scopulibacillus daqui]
MFKHFNRKHIKWTISIIIVLIFSFAVISVLNGSKGSVQQTNGAGHSEPKHTAEGKAGIFNNHAFAKAPSFNIPDQENHMVDLHDYRGQSVLVNVWTTWCKECQDDLASLQNISKKYPHDQLQILAVNMTTDETSLRTVQDYLKKHPLSFPVLLDTKGQVKKDYQVYGIPTSFLIDPYGRIIKTFQGIVTTKDIDDWLPQ